jgi:hypothetical protein
MATHAWCTAAQNKLALPMFHSIARSFTYLHSQKARSHTNKNL